MQRVGSIACKARLTPGVLLVCTTAFFVSATASNSWEDLAVLVIICSLSYICLGVSANRLAKGLRAAWTLLLLATGFHLGFRIINDLVIARTELDLGTASTETTFFLLRILLLIAMSVLVLSKHSPAVYAESVLRRLRPILGPQLANSTSHVTLISLALLPQIQEHARLRQLAREIRGINGGRVSAFRVNVFRQELIAMLRFAIDFAATVAIVLWSRGFTPAARFPTRRLDSNGTGIFAAIFFCASCLYTLLN